MFCWPLSVFTRAERILNPAIKTGSVVALLSCAGADLIGSCIQAITTCKVTHTTPAQLHSHKFKKSSSTAVDTPESTCYCYGQVRDDHDARAERWQEDARKEGAALGQAQIQGPGHTARKATSKKKPRKTETPEEPYPTWAAPTPAAAVEAVARLAAVHGLPSPPARKSILDSLVRTILSQNTTDKTSAATPSRGT